jgi:mannosylglycoprotein endo-beta-mannosidase
MEGFIKIVEDKWIQNRGRCPARVYSMDKWHGGVETLRNFLKGWGRNVRGEYRRRKEELMQQIIEADVEESVGMNLQGEQLCKRYQLEAEVERLMEAEEVYWQQRGGEKWTLEGDGNTKFFHLVANGRRRKNLILSLEHDGVNVVEPEQIQKIIYDYYKTLFGRHPGRGVRIGGMLGQTVGGCLQRTTPG